MSTENASNPILSQKSVPSVAQGDGKTAAQEYLFYWHCDECRLGGIARVRLPSQARNLVGQLESYHDKAHLHHCCTSDYFRVVMIERDNEDSPGTAANKTEAE